MKTIVILGAGTGGSMMANRLRRALPARSWNIVAVDRDDDHLYQPGLLFVPFGENRLQDLVRSRKSLFDPGIDLVLGELAHIDAVARRVMMADGTLLHYDFLIVATGCRLAPEGTEGLLERGWHESASDFYTPTGASWLAGALDRFDGGRLVVNIVEMPIKCPVAPLEFSFLADAYFTRRGIRDRVEIVYATPLDAAFTKPRAAAMLGGLLEERKITVEPNFSVEKVDGTRRTLIGYDGREIEYDLLVSVPLHRGSAVIEASGLGDASGFLPTDPRTLVAKGHDHIFALGDATDVPTSKAGSVAHFQSEVLTENVLRAIRGESLLPDYDGHANCFIETGHGKGLLIDFNYETEPLPGRFPLPGIGPFTLLEESHVNHWGKMAFRWAYWNVLARGKDMPLDHRMLMAGKRSA